ncbi:MAG: 2Fe-2S iron-sulfur cluster-binding protein, partial [Patescibacteria group bacterium]
MEIKINGQIFEAKEGETILAVCRRNKIDVPTLCFHDEFLASPALCRICLVEVKFSDGKTKTLPACSSFISAGTEIFTVSEKLNRLRPILADLNYGIRRKAKKNLNSNPFWGLDYSKCVLCRRCVSACNEITVNGALNVSGSGASEKIDTVDACDPALADCEFCGNCEAVCPTGAIFLKKSKKSLQLRSGTGERKIAAICPYCGCGCGLYLETDGGKIVGVSPNPAAPFNGFRLCAKGRFGIDFVNHKDRLKYPLIAVKKNGKKTGKFKKISWNEALDIITSKMSEVREKYGADTLAGISSSKCTNEENYLFQKIFRLFGT